MIEIIAEASKNWLIHEDMDINLALYNAKVLALTARDCQADCVKFQCHTSDELVKRDSSRHDWILLNEKLSPIDKFWEPLKAYCDEIGIEMLVTPMSLGAAKKINHLVKRWKVASPDINDWKLLDYLIATGKEIILSTGMSIPVEVMRTKEFLQGHPSKFLHCVSEYPCPLERLNINRVKTYDGLSDHTMSLITGALAVVNGATIIEKHFTVNGWGKDAHMSLNPTELKTYIRYIREAEKAVIDVELPTKIEKELRKIFIV